MSKTLNKIIALSLITISCLSFLVSVPAQACACGMLVPQGKNTVSMKGEQGVVVYDSASQNEQMAIDFELDGTSNESALVVPTPVKSDITQIKQEVFDDLKTILAPTGAVPLSTATMNVGSSVQVLEQKTVGSFEIAELKTNSYQDLYNWTRSNGFMLEAEAEGPVRTYIDNDYVLNVIKLKKNAAASDINPLKFTFKTDNYFYPLMEVKDSRDSQKDKSLTLYLLTDQAVTVPGATIINKVFSKDDLENGITKADDPKFSDLEFASSQYYLNYIKTTDYSVGGTLMSALGNPASKSYTPLGLDYSSLPPVLWPYIVLIVLGFMVITGTVSFTLWDRKREITKKAKL